jgi:hypothetical protein
VKDVGTVLFRSMFCVAQQPLGLAFCFRGAVGAGDDVVSWLLHSEGSAGGHVCTPYVGRGCGMGIEERCCTAIGIARVRTHIGHV